MYTPRYGMNYIAQQTVAARLDATSRARNNEAQAVPLAAPTSSHDEEAGALWRLLGVIAVVALVAAGSVLAVWVGGL